MRYSLIALCLSLFFVWSASAMAESIGIVNMRQIFQSSSQIKSINAKLNKKFSPQRDKIVTMGKNLQADVKKLQRNKSIMSKSKLKKLKDKIKKEQQQLRLAQAKFQQTLYSEQNKAMSGFMAKMNKVVKKIAEKRKLDLVLPKNSVLYAKQSMDITSEVKARLK